MGDFGAVGLIVLGSFLQGAGGAMQKHSVALRFPELELRRFVTGVVAVLGALVRSRLWLLGNALMLIGGLFFIQAISRVDVSVVIPLGSLVGIFAILIGVTVLREHLELREWLAVAVMLSGAVLLGLEARESGQRLPPTTWNLGLSLLAAAGSGLLLGLQGRLRGLTPEIAFSLAAGLQIGLGNTMIKVGTGVVKRESGGFDVTSLESLAAWASTPEIWIVILSNVIGFLLFQAAFAHGRVGVITAVGGIANILFSVAAGALVLGESLLPPRLLGIAAMLAGTVVLTRLQARKQLATLGVAEVAESASRGGP